MSKKRFQLSDWCGEQSASNVIDIEKQTHLTNIEVLDLLNEQQAIIQREIDEKINVQERLSYMIWKYNQLKQKNFDLQVKLSEQKRSDEK